MCKRPKSLEVFHRGMCAMSRSSVIMVLPSGIIVGICYLLIFGRGAMVQGESAAMGLCCGLQGLSVLNGAFADSLDALYARLRITKTYLYALETTPLTLKSVILGDSLVAGFRAFIYAIGVSIAAYLMFHVPIPVALMWGLLAFPCGVVLGLLCFCLCSCARSLADLNAIRFVLLPIFLFSGAVIPLSGFPRAVVVVSRWLPIWQVRELLLSTTEGRYRDMTNPAIYLITMAVASFLVSWINLRQEA